MRSMSAGRAVIPGPLTAVVVAAWPAAASRRAEAVATAADGHRCRGAEDERPDLVSRQGTTRALEEVTIRARVKGFLGKPQFSEGDNVKADQLLVVIEEQPYQIQLDLAKAKLEEATGRARASRSSRSPARSPSAGPPRRRPSDSRPGRGRRSASSWPAMPRRSTTSTAGWPRSRRAAPRWRPICAKLEQTRADYADEHPRRQSQGQCGQGRCRGRGSSTWAIARCMRRSMARSASCSSRPATLSDRTRTPTWPPSGSSTRWGSICFLPRDLPLLTRLMKSGLSMNLFIEGQRAHPEPARAYFIDNSVEPTTGTVLMKATVPNPDESLLPGQYVK